MPTNNNVEQQSDGSYAHIGHVSKSTNDWTVSMEVIVTIVIVSWFISPI